MKKNLFVFTVLLAALTGAMMPAYSQTVSSEKLKTHVFTLADDSLKGRKAGSPFSRKAAEYIANQWSEIGIVPLEGESYFVPFMGEYNNLVGVIEGNDWKLKDEYIVVGAHYDHLGFKLNGQDTVVFNGADDNASGVAAVIEMGRRLKELQPTLKRSVIVAAFDAEEIGLYGSTYFANNTPFPIENVKLMLSVDMVGWYAKSGYVKYVGVGTIKNGRLLVADKDIIPEGLNVLTQNFENSILTATDTEGFAKHGIPTLAVTTGLKSPYHKPEDDANLIDFDGLTKITEHLANTVQAVSRVDDFRASGKFSHKHRARKLVFGVALGGGNNNHIYSAGALDGKLAGMANIGLTARLDINSFALRTAAYYEYVAAKHPNGLLTTHGIMAPLDFVLQTPSYSSDRLGVFIGGYYSYKFAGRQDGFPVDFANEFNRNEVGLSYGLFLRFSGIGVELRCRNELTNFTRYKNHDGAYIRNHAILANLTYDF